MASIAYSHTWSIAEELGVRPQHGDVESLVLLGGVLRPTPFHAAVGRSVLDLPVAPGKSILQLWAEQICALNKSIGGPQLTARLMLNAGTPQPRTAWEAGGVKLRVEMDPAEFRGTGGILRDLACQYDDAVRLLVASAAQVLMEPIESLATALLQADADVSLIAHQDGTPANLMLVRCGCMRGVAELGFVDMKEQALPLIGAKHMVKVLFRSRATGLPVRTFPGYLDALRQYYSKRANSALANPFAENWQSCFAIVEDGAVVERGARIHDSVVLRGGVVGRNAVVARSVICPGGVVRSGEAVVDQVVAPAKGQAE